MISAPAPNNHGDRLERVMRMASLGLDPDRHALAARLADRLEGADVTKMIMRMMMRDLRDWFNGLRRLFGKRNSLPAVSDPDVELMMAQQRQAFGREYPEIARLVTRVRRENERGKTRT